MLIVSIIETIHSYILQSASMMDDVVRPRPFVFVLMPFAREFDDVYQLGIKPACERAGAYAERVDEQIFEGSILQRICNQIAKADLVVADMSGRNANVFYETGYAHALGKRVILLTRDIEDIPFDLKHHTHIIYGGRVVDLIPELEKRVRYTLTHPHAVLHRDTDSIHVRINDTPIDQPARVKMPVPASRKSLILALTLHNSAELSIDTRRFELGVVSAAQFVHSRLHGGLLHVVRLPDGRHLHLLGKGLVMLPDTWHTLEVTFDLATPYMSSGTKYDFAIRIFTPSGSVDRAFTVELV